MANTIETKSPVTKEEITVRAYLLWEKAGRPVGRDLEFWGQAEQQLISARTSAIRESLKATVKEVKAVAPGAILPVASRSAASRGTTTIVAATKPAKVRTSLPKSRKKSARF